MLKQKCTLVCWFCQPLSQQTTGKVIADLKFAFWVSMYTGRHDGRLWQPYLTREYPNLPQGMIVKTARQAIHDTADKVRDLRNRIAHHEPIYSRELLDEHAAIQKIIEYRCPHTAAWVQRTQTVSALLANQP